MKLSRKEQTVINYQKNGGNMKRAMIDAGYSETYADRNSKYLLGIIGEEIRAQQNELKNVEIKSVAEIQKWWSEQMENTMVRMPERIRCSENLVKSLGGFIEKLEVKNEYEMDEKIKEIESYIREKRRSDG